MFSTLLSVQLEFSLSHGSQGQYKEMLIVWRKMKGKGDTQATNCISRIRGVGEPREL